MPWQPIEHILVHACYSFQFMCCIPMMIKRICITALGNKFVKLINFVYSVLKNRNGTSNKDYEIAFCELLINKRLRNEELGAIALPQ